MAMYRASGGNSDNKIIIPSIRCTSNNANSHCAAILDLDSNYTKVTVNETSVLNMRDYEIYVMDNSGSTITMYLNGT